MQKAPKIILGIDPGTNIMGYGLIKTEGSFMSLVDLGVLKLSPKQDVYERLGHIHDKVASLIRQYKPSQFAIEAPFFGKNVQSMLKLGRAQGVAIAAAMQAGLPVCEYSPKKVKQSITGNGNAGKEQVLKMLEKLLHFEGADHYLDASDALAVAVCHYFQQKTVLPGAVGKIRNWQDFITRNPGRVKK